VKEERKELKKRRRDTRYRGKRRKGKGKGKPGFERHFFLSSSDKQSEEQERGRQFRLTERGNEVYLSDEEKMRRKAR